MQLKKIFRQYQDLLISITILLVSAFGLLAGIIPLAKSGLDINSSSATLSMEVDALNKKVSILQSADEDMLRSNLQALLIAVPSDKSLSTLLGTVDGLSAKTGVSVGTLSLTRPGSLATVSATRLTADERAVGSNILPFSLSVSGTLDQVKAFLSAAVSVRRLFRIRSFDIVFANTNVITANLSMDAFYSPLPSTIGTVRTPISALSATDTEFIAKITAMQQFAQPSAVLPAAAAGAGKPDPFSL